MKMRSVHGFFKCAMYRNEHLKKKNTITMRPGHTKRWVCREKVGFVEKKGVFVENCIVVLYIGLYKKSEDTCGFQEVLAVCRECRDKTAL